MKPIRNLLFCTLVLGMILFALLPFGMDTASASATLRYVASGGSCGGATPCYASVQAAVDAAAAGDEIRVAAGTYTGVNTQGGKSQHLYIGKNLTIKGGYTTANWNTPDPVANVTELQAQTLGRVVFVAQNVTTILDGFHLTYGNATSLGGHPGKDAGSAIYAYQATLTLNNCQVLHSSLPKEGIGGGLYASETALTINNTRFEDNTSGNGGGAYLYKSTSIIQNSQFVANQMSGLQSGDFAIHVEEGTLNFTGNKVQDNFPPSGAGSQIGINKVTQFTISQNQIIGATSGAKGNSGIYLGYSTGVFSENYVTNHQDSGVSVVGGFVDMNDNEIAYNNGITASSGGGVVFRANSLYASEFTMAGNHIHHNSESYVGMGGGVYISARTDNLVYLYDNVIEDNSTGYGSVFMDYGSGGGVYITGGDWVTLTGNLIQRNSANGQGGGYGGCGGGVFISGNATLVNNVITDNQALYRGSGVYVNGSTPYLYHNTIANNIHSTGDGSGVYSAESSSNVPGQPRLYNNIITNQTIGVYAGQGDVTSSAFIENVLWYGNGADTSGPGAFFVNNPHSGDPLYVNAASHDYHISVGSAAINIGTNENIPTGLTTDIDGKPRIANGIVDLGADEYDGVYLLTVTKSGNGSGDVTSNPVGINCGVDCSESFNKSTVVALTPVVTTGSFFGWGGHSDCNDGSVTMSADKICTAFFRVIAKNTFKSTAANDGWILESTETSGVGGTMDNAATTFNLGDNAQDKQYRAILSFNTDSLPDNAVITRVTLKIRKQGLTGADPFTTHGGLVIDIRKGAFGNNNALQLTDFQATASKSTIGTIPNTPVNNWYSKVWTSGIFTYINKTGLTQFRLRFQKDDNDDNNANYLKFFSGNHTTTSVRPMLIIEYYVP